MSLGEINQLTLTRKKLNLLVKTLFFPCLNFEVNCLIDFPETQFARISVAKTATWFLIGWHGHFYQNEMPTKIVSADFIF